MRRSGRVTRMGESRNVSSSSVTDLEGRRSFGIPRRRRNDNNKMDIKKIMWENMAWIYLAQDGGSGWLLWRRKRIISLSSKQGRFIDYLRAY